MSGALERVLTRSSNASKIMRGLQSVIVRLNWKHSCPHGFCSPLSSASFRLVPSRRLRPVRRPTSRLSTSLSTSTPKPSIRLIETTLGNLVALARGFVYLSAGRGARLRVHRTACFSKRNGRHVLGPRSYDPWGDDPRERRSSVVRIPLGFSRDDAQRRIIRNNARRRDPGLPQGIWELAPGSRSLLRRSPSRPLTGLETKHSAPPASSLSCSGRSDP